MDISLHCIHSLVLEGIGANLVMKANPSSLLPHIQQDTPTLLSNVLHGQSNLLTTITPEATKHIAGKALTVNPHQHRFLIGYITKY